MKTREQRIKWGRDGAIKRWSKAPPFEQRFWDNVNIASKEQCWEWKRSKTKAGYGKVKHLKKTLLAHRVALAIHTGKPIPKGLKSLHSCDNPPCCNPNHLFAGTSLDNTRDMIKKGRARIGSRDKFLKLSDGQIREIRNRFKRGEHQIDIAIHFGIHQSHVSKTVNFKRRKHVS